jgi:hypothetical protein
MLLVDDVGPDAVVAPQLEPLFARARTRLAKVAGFTPSQPVILAAAAPRWNEEAVQ